jgi:hypothetical protein
MDYPTMEVKIQWQAIVDGVYSPQWSTVVSRLSTQLEPRSFVRTLSVGAYFRCSIPKCVL